MATMNTFIFLTATATPTAIKGKRTVPFPWQLWLRERVKFNVVLTSSILFLNFNPNFRQEI